jgi:flagellar basal body rod protein FlgB
MLNRITDALDFQAQALTLRSDRQRLIASNIANADTPGYQARDMDFAKALQAATGSLGTARSVSTTHAGHIGSGQRRLERRPGRRRLGLRDRRPDQPRPQHGRHGPRARDLRRQRGQVRGDPALHQFVGADPAVRDHGQ